MKSLKVPILVIVGMIIFGIIAPFDLSAQTKAKIDNVDFSQDGTSLIITYDIIKSKPNETFQIWIHVYTKSGKKIIPNDLTGDVGSNVVGGAYKKIIWDMEADQVFLDEEISVDVYAQSERKNIEKQPVKKKEGISVGAAMGLSLALPGLGRRVVTGSGAAWLLGVAGYGCIGGAYYMNNSAYTNYENYKSATTTSQRDDYYQKAKNNDLYSKILIGSAATIWVVDLIITGVKAGKVRNSPTDQRLSFTTNYDPIIQQPTFGLKYRF